MKYILLVFLLYFCNMCAVKCALCARGENSGVLNCSGRYLTDCPTVNVNITELIMDNNKVEHLSKDNCSKWVHLKALSIKNNHLVKLVNLNLFPHLISINAKGNFLETVHLEGEQLASADFSDNRLAEFFVDNTGFLHTLLLGHNFLNQGAISKFLKNDILPNLRTLDLSFNQLNSVPINFISFSPYDLSSVNLAGNNITTIYFTLFTYTNHREIKLDLSYNFVKTLIISRPPSVYYLDLSHNQLSYVDSSSLSHLLSVDTIDLSNNPFNCSCLYIPPFISLMRQHNQNFIQQQSTKCTSFTDGNIFKVDCKIVSSPHFWPWILLLFLIVLGIIIFGIAFEIRRRNSMFTNFELLDGFSIFSRASTMFNSMFLRANTVGNINPVFQSGSEDNIPNQHLNFEDKLIIFCSSKDKKWVLEEICANITINKDIVDFSVSNFLTAEFYLLIVNGDDTLRDLHLLKNITLTLQNSEEIEMRVLVKGSPSLEILKNKNILTDYINNSIANITYFKFDDEYPLSCLDSLKIWMNLDV